jgi:hypothetical protein
MDPLDFGSFVLTVEMVARTFIAFMGAGLAAGAITVIAPGRS